MRGYRLKPPENLRYQCPKCKMNFSFEEVTARSIPLEDSIWRGLDDLPEIKETLDNPPNHISKAVCNCDFICWYFYSNNQGVYEYIGTSYPPNQFSESSLQNSVSDLSKDQLEAIRFSLRAKIPIIQELFDHISIHDLHSFDNFIGDMIRVLQDTHSSILEDCRWEVRESLGVELRLYNAVYQKLLRNVPVVILHKDLQVYNIVSDIKSTWAGVSLQHRNIRSTPPLAISLGYSISEKQSIEYLNKVGNTRILEDYSSLDHFIQCFVTELMQYVAWLLWTKSIDYGNQLSEVLNKLFAAKVVSPKNLEEIFRIEWEGVYRSLDKEENEVEW